MISIEVSLSRNINLSSLLDFSYRIASVHKCCILALIGIWDRHIEIAISDKIGTMGSAQLHVCIEVR